MPSYTRQEVNEIVTQLKYNGEDGPRIDPALQKAMSRNLDQYLLAVCETGFEKATDLTTLAGVVLQKLLVQVLAEQTYLHAAQL